MAAMERCDATINREKQMDELLNTVHVNYKKELTCLRHQLDSAVAKYNQKEVDCNVLEKKLEELEKKHSTTLLYKCDSMVRQESALQALLEEANKEKLEMNKKLMALQQGECNVLKVDLEQYESVSRFRLGNSSSDEHETDSMLYLGINRQRNDSKRSAHSGSPQADIVAKLKDELHRALVGQRVKRSEIKKLQEQIQSKELQIHEMKEKERSYLADAESLKSDMAKIMDQLKKEDGNDNQTVISQLRSEILNLNNENEKSAQRIKEYQAELKKLSNEFQLENTKQKKLQEDYISYHESEVTKLQLQAEEILKQKELEYGSKVDRLVKECSDIKQLYEELKFKNEKMVARLEQESKKLTEALIETDNLKKLLTQKENEALTLGKVVENLQKGALHEEQVKNITDMSTIQANVISSEQTNLNQ
ncbi:hypothetical protein AAG570_000025 [Ranatra chinensis]|uniref:Uncharacterized protein n=1 Tax=Ranatra chinensis TaxID=642074 RepID=A0ABD0ZH28_9HEMI